MRNEAAATSAAPKKAAPKKRTNRPVYLEFKRMVDPDTGEVRAELKQPRDERRHRRVHRLGQLVAQSIDRFAGMDAHSVIKKLQGDAGVCCADEVFDLGSLGRVTRSVPESLAFDEMPEERFGEFWRGISRYLIDTYWQHLDEDQVNDMVQMMPSEVA